MNKWKFNSTSTEYTLIKYEQWLEIDDKKKKK